MDAHLIQGSDSWKSWRRNCVTATDVSKIIGINPWCSALKLWNQKLGLEPEQEENQSMRTGSALEIPARERFIKETGINMTPAVKFHPIDSWKMASLDGVSDCGKYALEIKCSQKLYERTKAGFIDEIYKCQVNWQMYILDITMVYFMAYWNGDYALMEIKRDDDFLNKIMPKIHEFYNSMMDFIPPPATNKDYVKREDKAWDYLSEAWRHKKNELDRVKKEEEALRQELINLSGGLSTQGGGITLTKCYRKGNVQYDIIPELKSIDLEKYRKKPTEFYRIIENA